MADRWRVGSRVPVNLYRDGVIAGQCQSPEIAAEIASGINSKSDLYEALEDLLRGGQHEGLCDNVDETGEPYEDSGPCDLHIAAHKARQAKARIALAKARGEQPNAK